MAHSERGIESCHENARVMSINLGDAGQLELRNI